MTSTGIQTEGATPAPLPPWTPQTDAERETVREQVGRILFSALFRNSKRFPAFLRFTVEHALSSADGLKERTIGHQVFGRDPGYDTAQDPIVRMTAAEVRKRLTQYYAQPEHKSEMVIAYQPGSYVPEFFVGPAVFEGPLVGEPQPAPHSHGRPPVSWAYLTLATAGLLAAILLVLVVARTRDASAQSAVRRFWQPILNSSSPVLLCIGDPYSPRSGNPKDESEAVHPAGMTVDDFLHSNSVRYTDAVTLALLTGELRARGKSFRIRRPAATELQDLRDGPVVLIGGFNNPWTLRLSEGLRFTLAGEEVGAYIRDRTRPDNRDWQIPGRSSPISEVKRTYGLITRVADPATGKSVVTVAGLLLGTRAAGECLIDEGCLASAEQLSQGELGDRNLQIVVATTVIGVDSGAPRVVAVHTW